MVREIEETRLEGEEEEELELVPASQRRITWEPQAPSAFDLRRRYQRGRLKLQPSFQRRQVWDDRRKSKFVESVLLDVPLPYIYLAEEADGTQVVVDGQQRLNAVFSFIDGEYPLQNLLVMDELNQKLFRELDGQLQEKIENKSLPAILIKGESDEEIKFDVFERLNTGAVPLNAQELRNCLFRGNFNDLLIELSQNRDFQRLCGFTGPDRRMKDVELVLRFFAFYDATYGEYKKPMKRFLRSEMERRRSFYDSQAAQLRQVFNQTINLVKTVFGDNAFRRYDVTEGGGRWLPTTNVALQDVVMYGFSKRLRDRAKLVRLGDSIREGLLNILVNDQQFLGSLETHTSDQDRVEYRFRTWEAELNAILAGATDQGPRLFSLALKRDLFVANPTCQLCGQRIHEIDQAEIDHIEPYWKGGRTIPENARLAHRQCNRSRRRISGTDESHVSSVE